MDRVSETLFAQPRVFGWQNVDDPERLQQHLQKFSEVVPTLGAQRLLDLMGIPSGCQISLQLEENGSVTVSASNRRYGLELLQNAVINDDGQWQLVIHNFNIGSGYRRRGVATRILYHMAHTAANAGFKQIGLIGIRDTDVQGYWVWPMLGFNGTLESAHIQAIKTHLELSTDATRDLETLRDVYALEGGIALWREIGDTIWMEFDLSDNSSSWEIFRAYLKRKAIVLAEGWL